MSDTTTLLVADRDDELRKHLLEQLNADGFRTDHARTAAETRCRARRGSDLLLLGELEEPTSALRLLRELRAGEGLPCGADPALPVIVLSSAPEEWVPLRAFEAGCDDFMRKPVHYLELRGRIRALLRRCSPGYGRRRLRVGALAVDLAGHEASYGGRRLALSRMEFALLSKLAVEPTRVYTKEELLREVWGSRRSARRARSTPTPAGCGASSCSRGRRTWWSTCAASATGSSSGCRWTSIMASRRR